MRLGTRRACGLAALVLLAAACGGPPSSAPTTSTSPAPTTTVVPSPSPTAPIPTPSSPPAPAPTPSRTSSTAPAPSPTRSTPTPSPTGVPADLLGQDVRVIPTDRHVVALTFDGGAGDAGLARILAVLRAEHVRATFFLTGRFASTYPAGTRAVADAGHVIGNHTQTHPHTTAITDAELASEVRAAESTIRRVAGVSPQPWFRFPYGERTSTDIRLLNGLGYVCVAWTVDTLGWLGSERGTASDVTARVLDALRPGEIVLMHVGANPYDGTTYDADALESTIHALRARGYGFVTVEELLR